MSKLAEDIKIGMKSVGSDWKKAKKSASDRNDRVSHVRMTRMRHYEPKISIRRAAFWHMEKAYLIASSNGKYYANARQIMYAARPLIIEMVGINAWDTDKTPIYFQTLLKDFLEENGADMKVVWDARGHLKEPHTNYEIGLGGADVMRYHASQVGNVVVEQPSISFQKRIRTVGPVNRYGAVLFIEKEGFYEQLEDAGIAEKWDIAMMSSKGIPNAAACNVGAMVGVPVLVLHDFDLAGFKIVNTLRNGARLSKPIPNLIDIGLRLEDVADLESEPVKYKQKESPVPYLKSCGATQEECDFLVTGRWGKWSGRRVEINMFTTEQLIAFLERKLIQYGVKKVVPDDETINKTYRRAVFCHIAEEKVKEIQIKQDELSIPDDFVQKVRDSLVEDPSQSWDEVVWKLANRNFRKESKDKESISQNLDGNETSPEDEENLALDQDSGNGRRDD